MITKDSFVYRIIAAPGLKLIAAAEWLISKNSPNNAFFDASSFPWVKTLESSYPQIKKELSSLLKSNKSIPDFTKLSEEQKRIVPDEKWKTFIFCVYGKYVAKNRGLCPMTSSAIRNIPGIRFAMFSILEPGTHISRHRGPYKGVLRCHLALVVPQNEKLCAIQVNGETRFWEEGKTLVFDDTLEHEAWNNSDELRAVLFVDFERALPFWLIPMNKSMLWLIRISPFARNILANIGRHEK
jgi:aspartyl/asparaginyl beta-hydroxylase (cupin superfamily)